MTDGTQPGGRLCRPFILGSTIGIAVETTARLRPRIELRLIPRQKLRRQGIVRSPPPTLDTSSGTVSPCHWFGCSQYKEGLARRELGREQRASITFAQEM